MYAIIYTKSGIYNTTYSFILIKHQRNYFQVDFNRKRYDQIDEVIKILKKKHIKKIYRKMSYGKKGWTIYDKKYCLRWKPISWKEVPRAIQFMVDRFRVMF